MRFISILFFKLLLRQKMRVTFTRRR